MAVITITTVGYREVGPLSREGQLFTAALLFSGVGVAFYILTVMSAAIIEGDLRQVFGIRRMRTAIERLRDHYIVCGYGRVGQEIAREFAERRESFVVVDMRAESIEVARAHGVLLVEGDATSAEVLSRAGIERCRALIAASDSDAGNTFITLTAKGLRPDVFVVARVGRPDVESKLRLAGAGRVISPYAIGGRRMALAALQPIMTDFIDIVRTGPDTDRILAEFAVDAASGLAGKEIGDVLAACRDVVPLAVRSASGAMTVGPAASTRLALGDRLMVVGTEEDLRRVRPTATK
jgi:voltage-gated potassium channel